MNRSKIISLLGQAQVLPLKIRSIGQRCFIELETEEEVRRFKRFVTAWPARKAPNGHWIVQSN